MNPQTSPNADDNDSKSLTILSMVIARAWRDPAYLKNLQANPEAALVEEGLTFPAGTNFTVLQNTATVRYVPLARDTDPQTDAAQLGQLLAKLLPIAPGSEVRFVQSTDNQRYVVIPVVPASVTATTSERQLHQLALADGVTTTTNVQTAVNVSTAVNAGEVATVAVAVVAGAIVVT